MLNNRFDSSYYYIILVLNCAQIAPQTQSVAPHTEVEHQTERHDNRRHNVEPTTLEGACVRLDRHYRVGTKWLTIVRSRELLRSSITVSSSSLIASILWSGSYLKNTLTQLGA